MPEGDTILLASRRLGRALSGKVVTAYRSVSEEARATDVVGRTIERVEAHGKNLFMHFDDGRVLYSHMRMTGSWHVYRKGEPWHRPPTQMRLVLEAGPTVAVCFNAPVVQLISGKKAELLVASLGPDVLEEEAAYDAPAIARRLRARGDLPIGEAIMHQGLIAGVGNIYKSETLFACKVDPFVRGDHLDDATLLRIVETARVIMSRNLDGKLRQTREGGGYRVYMRGGKPCLECGTPIEMRRQGDAGRSTYYCPVCQHVGPRHPMARVPG